MTTSLLEPSVTDAAAPSRRIVVGVDNDPASLGALRFAADEAALRGGAVLALHVLNFPASWRFVDSWPHETRAGEAILAELQAVVDGVVGERAEAGAATVAITAEVHEGVTDQALSAAADGGALLVLGAAHPGWFEVDHNPRPSCPVVVVSMPLPPR